MSKLTIKIEEQENGFVCVADNGDLPFEGRIHDTAENAMNDLLAAYGDTSVWETEVIDDYTINIETE